ncbi:MAG: hypothetical protein KKG99_05090, partial [Bacteroidetes bacterium]|nr:hypothetical protein [Bacteroidota bacterium]
TKYRISDISTKTLPVESGKIGTPVQITIIIVEGSGSPVPLVLNYGSEKETLKVINGVYTIKRYFEAGTYSICAELIQ